MMKKLMAVLLSLALAVTLCFGACAESLEGGWAVTADTAVTEEAQKALDSALTGFVGSNIEAVALLGTQLVSGTNYCLLCRVTPVVPNATGTYALVYVYQPLSGDAELMNIVDIVMNAYEEEEDAEIAPLSAEAVDEMTGADDGHDYASWTDDDGTEYGLFTVTAFVMDDDHHVTGITGSYSTVGTSEDGYYCSVGEDKNGPFTYTLADDFHADMTGVDENPDDSDVTDLYTWYVNTYMGGEAGENGELDFWFVTTKIALNDAGEVDYMTYVYVPWA